MALNETHFEHADRGSTSIFKFVVKDDPAHYVWFEYRGGNGSLHTTPEPGPYRVDQPLESAEFPSLDALLEARGTLKTQWIKDLMAQYGEWIGWQYP